MASIEGTAQTPPDLAPVSPRERITQLDVLRGIALFGVLLANIWLWFSGTIFRFPELMPRLSQFSADTVAFFLVAIFVSGKAITTFSFLFGLGFAVQMMRAEASGRAVGPLFSRRMAILFVMGVLHAVFLWYGDILATYALLGFVLLLFRHRTDKTVLIWAVLLVAVLPPVHATVGVVIQSNATEETEVVAGEKADDAVEPASDEASDAALLEGFISGEPGRIIRGNLLMLRDMYSPPRSIRKFWLLGVFLIGLWAGRRRIFENPAAHRTLLRRLVIWGFPVGFVATLAETGLRIAFGGPESPLWLPLALAGVEVFSTAPFALAYIATATLLLERGFWRRMLTPFAPVGRMALTNYIGQTIVCLILYIGFGLMEKGGHALGLILSFAIFGGQILLSAWWLKHFRFGPLEWLWRSATYGRMQSMRVETPLRPADEVMG